MSLECFQTHMNVEGRLKTLDFRTLWDALGQRPIFRTVSQVDVKASHTDGDGMVTEWRRNRDGHGLKTQKVLLTKALTLLRRRYKSVLHKNKDIYGFIFYPSF